MRALRILWQYSVAEWRMACGSRLLRAVLWWIPLTVCAFMAVLFNAGSVRGLPVALLDYDQSSTSRALARYYSAAPELKIKRQYSDRASAYQAMRNVEVYAVISIPKGYQRQLLGQQSPSVQLDYNGLYMLSGKTVASAVSRAHATFAAGLIGTQALAKGQSLLHARALAQPLRYQLQAMFNMANNYAIILVPSVFIMVWQLALFVATVISLVLSEQQQGLRLAFGEHPLLRFTAKSLPLFCWSSLAGAVSLWFGYRYGHWPLYGSVWPQLFAGGLAIFASISIASLFYWLSRDAVKALGLAGMFAAPALAYMGVTFPQSDMPAFAHFWHGLIPSSHLVKVMLHYGHLGSDQGLFAAPFAALLALGAVFYSIMLLLLISFKARA